MTIKNKWVPNPVIYNIMPKKCSVLENLFDVIDINFYTYYWLLAVKNKSENKRLLGVGNNVLQFL